MTHIELNPDHLQSHSETELLREANQRISSHLGWLTGQIKARAKTVAVGPVTLAREEVAALLEETAAKILSVGHLHHSLAERPSRMGVELSAYVSTASSALIASLGLDARVSIVNRAAVDCMVSSEQAQIVGLMVSEVLMNAVKYAHPTRIPVRFTIECRSSGEDSVILSLRDDGVGLPEGMDASSLGGTGFKRLRSLAASLGADLRIESDALGLSVVTTFTSQARSVGNTAAAAANVHKFPK